VERVPSSNASKRCSKRSELVHHAKWALGTNVFDSAIVGIRNRCTSIRDELRQPHDGFAIAWENRTKPLSTCFKVFEVFRDETTSIRVDFIEVRSIKHKITPSCVL